MMLHYSTHQGWFVWHAQECREIKYCRWIDTQARTYCVLVYPPVILGRCCLLEEVFEAERIEVLMEARTVIINPIEDEAPGELVLLESRTT